MIIGSYVEIGFDHILDPQAYDHLLFIVVLCVAYRPKDWRRMLFLITAFTIGHSATLALAALDVVSVNRQLVETLIPITIIISALLNIFEAVTTSLRPRLHYMLALVFGLVHGLGFSNELKSLLDKDESVVPLLLSFNIGVELGQIVIVAVFFAIAFLLLQVLKTTSHKHFNIAISSVGALVALALLLGFL